MLKISTSVSVASAWCRAKNVSPLEVMGDRSFSPAQARERTSARRGPLRVTAPVVAARTGSARKSIANSRLEGQGGPGEATVHPPDLCKVLGSTW